jgi:hypothetical protein
MSSQGYTRQEFQAWWRWMSHRGWCDALLSADYERVLGLWEEAGRPTPRPFIHREASWSPDAKGDDDAQT